MSEALKFAFTKLNNTNYYMWKFKMTLLLQKEKVYDVITGEEPSPSTESWTNKNQQAFAMIGLNIEDDQLIHIRSSKTARAAWESLQKYHEKGSANTKVRLFKSLMAMKLHDDEDMERHITCINEAFHQLTDLNKDMTADDWKVAVMLGSLPESYDALVSVLESRPEGELSASIVQSRLIDEFKRRQFKDGGTIANSNSALSVKDRKDNYSGNKVSECFFCHKKGHFKRNCERYKAWLKRKNGSNNSKYEQKANMADQQEFMFIASSSSSSSSCVQSEWVIDSGATSHIVANKEMFDNIDEAHKDKIRVANGQNLDVCGRGTVKIQVVGESSKINKVTLNDVLWVPSITTNLMSVNKLISKGLNIVFTKYKCEIRFNERCIASGVLRNNLYILKQPDKVCIAYGHSENCIHEWHRKCGHRDIEAIKRLSIDGLVEGANIIDCGIRETCDVCQIAKQARSSFPKQANKHSKEILDLVHSDVCGPMQTETPSKKRYMLTFIDDHTRYTVIYLLRHKSETLLKLKEYVEMCYNRFGRKPKAIRSDRGGEYTGNALTDYLKQNGIEIEYTVAHSPQQNGIAERKNRTLVEMGRCMILEVGLSYTFWGEAINTANFIQNRLPTRATGQTPFEGWYKRKPNISEFRKFGSKCFVCNTSGNRQKLDPKAFKAVFVGYDEQSKGYRCFNPITQKVTISRDVKFDVTSETVITAKLPDTNDDNKAEYKNVIKEELNEDGNASDTSTIVNIDPEGDTVRVSSRTNKGVPSKRYIEEANLAEVNIKEPKTYNEAISSCYKEDWIKAMKEEIESLEENNTWTLEALPKNRKAIGSKWVFKIKYNVDGSISKYKARLVAQGFGQKYGEDYDEVFAPVVRQSTFRVLLSIASQLNMYVEHLDAKTAFLNGTLDEIIYMNQPPGFVNKEHQNKVCRLHKSIYGLKQAARVWNMALHQVLIEGAYNQCQADPCLYTKSKENNPCYVLVYVDDILVASRDKELIEDVEKTIKAKFDIKSFGPVKHYLGLEIGRDKNGNFTLSQETYIKKVVLNFQLHNAKPSVIPLSTAYGKDKMKYELLQRNDEYQQLIGCLLYIAVNTRPDISASISILAQKTSKPDQGDWNELKRVLKYLKGTSTLKLSVANPKDDCSLVGYADANWAEFASDRKSNSGYTFFVYGMLVSWSCRKQTCVSLLSTEAEFVSLSEACKEGIWLRRLLNDFNIKTMEPTIIYEDNQSCLKLIREEKLSNRSKHIDIKYYFVKEHVDRKEIDCQYCSTDSMIADMMTKPLTSTRLRYLRELCGVREI